jgi:hypothetical protein
MIFWRGMIMAYWSEKHGSPFVRCVHVRSTRSLQLHVLCPWIGRDAAKRSSLFTWRSEERLYLRVEFLSQSIADIDDVGIFCCFCGS